MRRGSLTTKSVGAYGDRARWTVRRNLERKVRTFVIDVLTQDHDASVAEVLIEEKGCQERASSCTDAFLSINANSHDRSAYHATGNSRRP